MLLVSGSPSSMSARSKPAGAKVQVGLFAWPATQVCCARLSVENPVKPSDPRGLAWLKTLLSWRRKSPPIWTLWRNLFQFRAALIALVSLRLLEVEPSDRPAIKLVEKPSPGGPQ